MIPIKDNSMKVSNKMIGKETGESKRILSFDNYTKRDNIYVRRVLVYITKQNLVVRLQFQIISSLPLLPGTLCSG